MSRKHTRSILTVSTVALLAAGLFYAFMPRAKLVDIGAVTMGPMSMSIDEEARTQVHDTYVVSTPVAARLLRVHVEPGDPVIADDSIVAHMRPDFPAALDARSLEQAGAEMIAAEARLRSAYAERLRAVADKALADRELVRIRRLRKNNSVAESEMDRALRATQAADAALESAEASIAIAEANKSSANANLVTFDDQRYATDKQNSGSNEIVLRAPTNGQVLRVLQTSETTLPAGTPILEIGDIHHDLEILVELLSSDAVQVKAGMSVDIVDWGGSDTLNAVVKRIEPWGFTKVSALGVEEQRVNALVQFVDPLPESANLGHGFRVEARIVIWHDDDTLVVPSNALFRQDGQWTVFVVEDGTAQLQTLKIGRNNGTQAQVLEGLEEETQVVLYPSSELIDGDQIMQRPTN